MGEKKRKLLIVWISYLCLGQRSVIFQNENLFFSENVGSFKTKNGSKEMKTDLFELDHWIKMAAMPIYWYNFLKIFFSGTIGPTAIEPGM